MPAETEISEIKSLLEQGRINKAEVLIAQYLRQTNIPDQHHANLLVYRAEIFLATARPDRALDELNRIHNLDFKLHKSPRVLRIYGDCYFARFELASVGFAQNQDLNQAQEFYDTIMRLHPSYQDIVWIHYQLGRILLISDAIPQASEHFRRVLSHPDSTLQICAYCYERLAFIAFYHDHQAKQALSYLERIPFNFATSDDNEWIIQVNLLKSRIFISLHHVVEARTIMETAIDLAIKHRGDGTLLRDTLLSVVEQLTLVTGHDQDIIRYLEQYIQLSKAPVEVDVTWSRIHQMLGNALGNTQQYPEAILAYQTALQANPYTPWKASINYQIAKCFYLRGHYRETISVLSALRDDYSVVEISEPEYLLFDLLGSAYFALGNYTEALNAFDHALESAPKGTDIREKIKLYHRFSKHLVK